MNLLQNGVIAMLAAVGLSTLVWLVVSALTRLGYHPAMPMWFVIPARGDAPELQQTVHELERLRREKTRRGRTMRRKVGFERTMIAIMIPPSIQKANAAAFALNDAIL